jgi:hypothetical protein
MSLDKGFEVFANWQTVVFALGIYLLTYVGRTVVEHFWKGWKANKLYTDLVLHLFPIVGGGLIALASKKFPWPMPIADSASARIFYGAILGMFCGVIYGRIRAWMGGKTNIPLPGGNAVELPPAPPEEKAEEKAEEGRPQGVARCGTSGKPS